MKKYLLLLAIALPLATLPFNTLAQTDLTISGSGKLFPIAMPQLCLQSGAESATKEAPRVMARDLDLSGYFQVINPGSYIETPGKCPGPDGFAYSDWSIIGAEGLVRGVVTGSGRNVKLQLFLHDVQRQKAVLGKEYEGDVSLVPQMAHKFANEIMQFFTGQYGVFGTQIAFSSRIGRFKELAVMDMDGSNLRQLTNDKGLSISASWHPAGKDLVYTSYRNRVPDLFSININSRSIKQLTRGPAMDLGAEFSKDGSGILLSRATGQDSDIVLLNSDGTLLRPITQNNGAIDVSPSWAPDGSKFAFCSNRAGGPQIYTMNMDGSEVKRVSFVSSNYCTSPAWSPNGDKIAFVCRADRGFQLFVVNSDGSNPLQLTSFGSNEDPAWAPNGSFLAFATTFGRGHVFNIALIRPDGSNLRQLTNSKSDDTQPTWGPANQ